MNANLLCSGDAVFSMSGGMALKKLIRFLTLGGVANAEAFTLKSFRAGKATEMAAQGNSLGAILEAGEWHSRALLNYVDPGVADHVQILKQTVDGSDDEGEGPE